MDVITEAVMSLGMFQEPHILTDRDRWAWSEDMTQSVA